MSNKRANPFLEDFIPQSKVHVGTKQFNTNEERLKKVYEKTLQLLFKGAKKLPVAHTVPPDPLGAGHDHKKDNLKQLFINKNGALEHCGEVVSEKLTLSQQCSCGQGRVEGNCAYCEERLCACSQHMCMLCEQSYCSRCSLIGYQQANARDRFRMKVDQFLEKHPHKSST